MSGSGKSKVTDEQAYQKIALGALECLHREGYLFAGEGVFCTWDTEEPEKELYVVGQGQSASSDFYTPIMWRSFERCKTPGDALKAIVGLLQEPK